MTDLPADSTHTHRVLALGYLRADLLMTDAGMEGAKAWLASLAREHGYALGTVFIEQSTSAPCAFNALIAAVQDQQASAVLVPTMKHFSGLGTPAVMKQHLERKTSARLVIADPSQGEGERQPEDTGRE